MQLNGLSNDSAICLTYKWAHLAVGDGGDGKIDEHLAVIL